MPVIAVLGATGKVGRTTIAALRNAGEPVRAIVRDQSKGDPFVAAGCEVAIADLRSPATLAQALAGASAVQVICPVSSQADDAAGEMRGSIEALAEALEASPPPAVLAISDYGAEVTEGTGVTALFHFLEERLRRIRCRLTFVRSAEHMENWARVIKVAAQTGVLPSLHHPLTKLFPTVSAFDVGAIAADLLLSPVGSDLSPRIVHAEGPRRYTPTDVAGAMQSLLGREVVARQLPRTEWADTLRRGGLSDSYARLVVELYDAHNAGRIDAQPGVGTIRRGRIDLVDALRPLVPSGPFPA